MNVIRNTGRTAQRAFFALIAAGIVIAAPLAAESELIKAEATASYYGDEFNGRPTSSGEIFDMNALTAAHKTLPFGTMLEITNLDNGKKVIVRVNDRGPFVEDRELDVSKGAAARLEMLGSGTARVAIRKIDGIDAAAAQASTGAAGSAEATAAAVPAENAASASTATLAATTVTVSSPVLATASSGATWRIQLGAFSREENAAKLVARLRKDGFTPAFEKVPGITRVVLVSIADSGLSAVKDKLSRTGYSDFLVRKESW